MRRSLALCACGLVLQLLAASGWAQPSMTLAVGSAQLLIGGEPVESTVVVDRFGAGLDSIDLPGARVLRSQLRWSCRELPEGDYCPSLLVISPQYFTMGEYLASRIHLYHNDEHVIWTRQTEPRRPEDAADQAHYQTEITASDAIHIRNGDVLRIMYAHEAGSVTVGPLRLHARAPEDARLELPPPDWDRPRTVWLHAWWEEPERREDSISQRCVLVNPGVRPRTFTLRAEAKDYRQAVLLESEERITLAPDERVARAFSFRAGESGRSRLSLTAAAEGVFPDERLVKFYVDDREAGPRPNACLNGDWEMCFVPGAEAGDAPADGATWESITIPSLQSNEKGHCAWYRRTFDAPAHLAGERIILRCGQVLSEAWFYVNGQPVGHERHGSQPFEVDITSAFRPGQANEILVAVRDWLSYSPKNRERVARGEAPIYKDSMVDVAGYTAAASLGLGGSLWLEARPAVSVDDVFVATSVRERKLSLRYRLRNTTDADLAATLAPSILDAGEVVKRLPTAEYRIPAGKTRDATVEMPWPDAKLWWPDDPHLYVLQTDLLPESGAADRHYERFGFREMWIDGISFSLNGTRVKIRSAWASGAIGASRAAQFRRPEERLAGIWEWQTECIQNGDHQLTRSHLVAGVDEACDVADETGLMIKLESEVGQVNFTFDQAFWNAALEHELRVMDIYKNHPSVVMWSAGNENMWGWIYQGEAAKTLGNRWQVRIAQAMRDSDLMRRPIEWEADGDLMGSWEHHALHYPRELNQFPDLPDSAWWGRLDGKTVVPYSMGPITLGEKPLTVGECFWPATLRHPFGETIIIGDKAYLGGNHLATAWRESSRFFLNGFRDVEFALIDTYLPLSILPPQTVVLKQEDRSFVGGRELRRELNVHNDVRRPAALALKWSLTTDRVIAGDARRLRMAPAEAKRLTVNVPLPSVREPTPATWRVELLEGGRLLHAEARDWMIHPPTTVAVPEGHRLSLYDPQGETAAMLGSLNVPVTVLDQLRAPAGGGLVIGRDALKTAPTGPWRESLGSFVRAGGKVLILEQSDAPDFLPTPLTVTKTQRCTMAYVRATDHPALKGLTDADLRWWTPDHHVSAGNYRKPVRGNFLPLVDAGTMDGILEAPIIEEYEGKGSYLLCQMALSLKAAQAPPAARLLQNLLDYLAMDTVYREPGRTVVMTGANSSLRSALDDTRLAYEDAAQNPSAIGRDAFDTAIVDASLGLDEATAGALRSFAEAGGKVMVHGGGPEQQAALEALTGVRLRFSPVADEPADVQNRVCRRTNDGLLAGISNHELFWASNAYLSAIRSEGVWWSYYPGGCPDVEMIADYYVTPADADRARAVALTRPGTLLQVPVGDGYVLLSQLRLDAPVPDTAITVARLRSLLLTNLGCALGGEGGAALARSQRLKQYAYAPIDLSPLANRGVTDDPDAGIVGWTNQGENDMRALPTGRQTFGGVPFDIASPKAAVVLYSNSGSNRELPREVTGIPIGRRADALFFLHSMAWASERPFRYRVNYEDGTSEDVEIINGRHVIDWWDDPLRSADAMSEAGAFVAWTGDNPMRKGVVLCAYEWTNPTPGKTVRDVDFLALPESNFASVPVLAGLTAAVMQTNEGVVVDVIGTRGVKVRLGTQEREVYYIGVAGIPDDHPYCAQAIAAHRALVQGQKVTILDDVIGLDSDGHRIAYVYLGRDVYNINNLVNAKVIGDGLGELGRFDGNNRQRMYLQNLAFIARQRKAGMWAEAE